MINKKNVLGKPPDELGTKDAIHTAIVSVRAAHLIKPGQWCRLNENREAVVDSKNGVGVADPFRREAITRGEPFWLILGQEEVPNVRHVWEHPTVDFSPPAKPVEKNKTLARIAEQFKVTYEQLMAAAAYVVANEQSAPYPGTLSDVELAGRMTRCYDLWEAWAEETGHEWYDEGTACCPEPLHPDCKLFKCRGA